MSAPNTNGGSIDESNQNLWKSNELLHQLFQHAPAVLHQLLNGVRIAHIDGRKVAQIVSGGIIVTGASEDHHADGFSRAGKSQRADQIYVQVGIHGIFTLWAIEGDCQDAICLFSEEFLVLGRRHGGTDRLSSRFLDP